ncbi:MAG: ATP-binding cassette domain-containing protein [Mycobacteriaceae bacterium]|nr:ATP-binding cassette domain-containing protein [Mycobacteriaceae bacterium]
MGKDVIDLLDVSVSYDGRPVLRDVEWRIAAGERTGIVGANGAGKSTLLGLLAGTVEPDSGRVKRGKTVRLAVLDQQATSSARWPVSALPRCWAGYRAATRSRAAR